MRCWRGYAAAPAPWQRPAASGRRQPPFSPGRRCCPAVPGRPLASGHPAAGSGSRQCLRGGPEGEAAAMGSPPNRLRVSGQPLLGGGRPGRLGPPRSRPVTAQCYAQRSGRCGGPAGGRSRRRLTGKRPQQGGIGVGHSSKDRRGVSNAIRGAEGVPPARVRRRAVGPGPARYGPLPPSGDQG